MIKLSAVIITFNEEDHLEKCLKSLNSIADEIIVVDSFSTDRTSEICKSFNVTFIQHKFEGYIEQKNYAVSLAKNDYIISLDGDEALSETLKTSILNIKSNWQFDGYYCNRLNNYCGQWIKHSDWYPDKKLRLFKKESGEWKGINPHDSYTLKKGLKSGKLKGDLLHWIYRDYSDHNQKVERFSTIAAGAYYKLGKKSSIWKIIYRPTWAFFKSYFLRLGFLDGLNGYIICVQTFNVTFLIVVAIYSPKSLVHLIPLFLIFSLGIRFWFFQTYVYDTELPHNYLHLPITLLSHNIKENNAYQNQVQYLYINHLQVDE